MRLFPRKASAKSRGAIGPSVTRIPVCVLLALVVLSPSTLQAQEATGQETAGRVLAARFSARIPEAGSERRPTTVEIEYRVVADRDVDRVPIKGLTFFDVTPNELRASVEGIEATSHLGRERGALFVGAVELPETVPAGDSLELTLSYQIPTAIPEAEGGFDIVLPILFVDWKPAGAPEDMLQVSIHLPSEYSVQEAFPTVPKEISTREGTRQYDFQLQTVPSLIRLRGEAGAPSFLTFSRLVDLGVVLLLGIIAAFGWQALRRERNRASADNGVNP